MSLRWFGEAKIVQELTPKHFWKQRANLQRTFRRIDRRGRLLLPRAQDFLARAAALRELEHHEAALRDLDRAMEIDPTNPDVNHALLQWGSLDKRDEAAKRLLEHGPASSQQMDDAVQHLLQAGAPLAHRVQFVDGKRIAGWVVWRENHALTLRSEQLDGCKSLEIEPQLEHRLSRFGRAASFDLTWPTEVLEATLLLNGEMRAQITNFCAGSIGATAILPSANHTEPPDHVMVVVPVYADLEATKACLDSLARQRASIQIRTVVIDDASPDEELKRFLQLTCEAHDFSLVSNTRNMGFVGAVNEGLSFHQSGDILFLNADVTLPADAVERLRQTVYSDPKIGTATPFSNNGEFTSFPAPFCANPTPSLDELAQIDRVFRDANASLAISLPSGVGFCLYVKRACFEAIGPLSRLYSPGYGEDSEFCLTARIRGYRNVCAADVFVSHAGGRSFQTSKRALVSRNHKILEERFPDYRLECAAFLHADPLRQARARAERKLPPQGDVRLLVIGSPAHSPSAQVRFDWLRRYEPGETVISLQFVESVGKIELSAFGSTAPKSLAFDIAIGLDMEALKSYLGACHIDRIEIIGADDVNEEIYALSSSLHAPIDIISGDAWPLPSPPEINNAACDSEDRVRPCSECLAHYDLSEPAKSKIRRTLGVLQQVLTDESRIVPLDPLAAAFTPYVYSRWPMARFEQDPEAAIPSAGNSISVLVPSPSAAVDALLKRLGREMRRAGLGVDVIVFGACLDDEAVMASGAIFVTGPASAAEYPEMIKNYEIGHLFCPYRKGNFWTLNGPLRNSSNAYFDWSFGVAERRESDLVMDPRICDAQAVRQLISWITSLSKGSSQPRDSSTVDA